MSDAPAPDALTAADPVAIARALIRCPSVTPEDAGVQDWLAALLAAHGFECHRLRFSDRDTPDVDNLYARIGTAEPVLMFAGHTDVVPPGDESLWSHPPFAAEIAGDTLYGRGAVDMKGAIAAFAAAAISWIAENGPPRGSIVLAITGDEEGPAINGTGKLLEWAAARGVRFDAAIVGEPSNPDRLGDMIKVGRRGSLSARITVTGRQGHVAYPRLAANPVPGLLRILNALTAAPLDDGTPDFDASNLEITSVDVGNPAVNVIPERATAAFNIRFNDRHSADSLKAWARDKVAEATPPGLGAELAFEPNPSVVFLTRDERLIGLMSDAVEAETGRRPEPSTTGGTSDARYIKDYCPVVEFGLVNRTIHQVDEHVPLADLHALTRIYRDFLARYFGSAPHP
jgi:succinyl-diaminopimelate desuccinylase